LRVIDAEAQRLRAGNAAIFIALANEIAE